MQQNAFRQLHIVQLVTWRQTNLRSVKSQTDQLVELDNWALNNLQTSQLSKLTENLE